MEPLNSTSTETILTPASTAATPEKVIGQKIASLKSVLFKNKWRSVITVVVLFIIAYYLLDFFGILGLLILILAIFLGFWFPRWYLRRQNPKPLVAAIFAWLNIALWILPPLGLLGSIATLGFAKYYPASRKKYLILGAIGLALTIINGVWGALSA